MTGRFVLYVLTCGPLVLTGAAWMKLYFARQRQMQPVLALVALGIVSANAAMAAGTFLYYELRPLSHFVPPWQDPEILQLGLLFVLAPIGMVFGLIAGARGAPRWIFWIVEIASLPLLVIGFMAGVAV